MPIHFDEVSMLRARDRNDVSAGIFLIGIAVVFLWSGWGLTVGTLGDMGPGYFPRVLCWIEIGLGSAILVSGFTREGPPSEPWGPRPLLLVLAAVAFFGMTIEDVGLPLALTGLIMIAGLAQRGARHLHNLVLAIVLAGFSVLVFVSGLGLQMSAWPRGLLQP